MEQNKEPGLNQPLENQQSNSTDDPPSKPKKPPKIEEKPFEEFINEHLLPSIENELKKKSCPANSLVFSEGERPVTGGKCWLIHGEFPTGREFYLTFSSDSIKSLKNISLAESSSGPSCLESFLIDEKKITLQLLTSRLIQRLNAQKWFGNN